MKAAYDTTLNPPAPFLPVRVSNLTDILEPQSVAAKIDTGSDVTGIPARLVGQLSLMPVDEILVEGYDGRQATIACYDVNLRIDHLSVAGLSVITIAEDYVLLGRDVLNRLRMLLDGPALMTEILT